MSIFNPYVILGAIVTALGVYFYGHHVGWSERDAEMQIEIAKKNGEARELEKNMTSKLAEKETELRKAQDEISKKQSAMHELARTGKLRLPTASCVQASPSASTSTGDKQDATDIERQTISALIDLVTEGDKAITKLNSCIDSYNEVRTLINGQ